MKRFFNFLVLSVFLYAIPGSAQVQISIDGNSISHKVNPMVQGFGLVYSNEADAIYADGSMAQLFEDVGAGFLRWPGGTVVTHYHWNELTGNGWSDSWDPNYNHANDKDPSEYMDLDEYMALCAQAGTEPMLGINLSSGMEWNRQSDGVQEAIDMINYCISNNYDVRYFYLDNETYHSGNNYNKDVDNDGEAWTAESYAAQFNIYANAIRALIPDAVLIANWSHSIRNNGDLNTLITIAGSNIDYMDVHWYWAWGNADWNLWKAQKPMKANNQSQYTYADEAAYFNNLTAQLGKPHIKLASLEWNIGPGPWENDPAHSKFKTALMQSEIQMQIIQSGVELAALWAVHWPNTPDASDKFLVDPDNGYTPNPLTRVYELYKNAIDGDVMSCTSAKAGVEVTTVLKDDKAYVYLLNKNNGNETVEFHLAGYDVLDVEEAMRFKDPGVFMNMGLWQVNGHYRATLWPNTLTMIVFNVERQNWLLNGDFEAGLINWYAWQNATTTNSQVAYGNLAAQLNGNAGVSQWVKVKSNTTYTLSGFAKVVDPQNAHVNFGVRDKNNQLIEKVEITDTDYTLHKIMFTTGGNADSVKIFYTRPASGVDKAYLDEVVLKETAYALNAGFEQELHAWDYYGGTTIETGNPIEGTTSLRINGKGGASQKIKTKPGTTYEIRFVAMVENPSKPARLHVKNDDGVKYFEQQIFDTQPTEYTITFTTDANDEDSQIGFWRPNGAQQAAFLDGIQLTEVPAPMSLVVQNPSANGLATTDRGSAAKTGGFDIRLMPNPATESVFIDINGLEEEGSLLLYNLLGEVVESRWLAPGNGITLPVAHLAPGTYLLKVHDHAGNFRSVKLLIN